MSQAKETATPPPLQIAGEGEISIYTAPEWKWRIECALEGQQDIDLDLSDVREIDSAGLQLLIMAKKETERRGRTLRLLNHSPAVLEVLGLCGLESFFGDPILIPSSQP